MRRIAFFCLAIAALSTTTLTASTEGALAAKSKQEKQENLPSTVPAVGTQGALAAKTKQNKLVKSENLAVGTKGVKVSKLNKGRLVKSENPAAPKQAALAAQSKQNSLVKSENSSEVVSEARRWIGTNPTGWDRVWCARFMNFVLKRTGHPETGSDAASSFASYGRRVWGPQVGAIAVMSRGKNGGHVGVVSGFDKSGNPIVISGNHNRCSGNSRGNGRSVGVAVYPRDRIYAYVMPR